MNKMMYDLKAGLLHRKRLAMAGKKITKCQAAYVRSKYGASPNLAVSTPYTHRRFAAHSRQVKDKSINI